VTEFLGIAMIWLLPLVLVGWVLSLVQRAVRALESIAESLRGRNGA